MADREAIPDIDTSSMIGTQPEAAVNQIAEPTDADQTQNQIRQALSGIQPSTVGKEHFGRSVPSQERFKISLPTNPPSFGHAHDDDWLHVGKYE